ncbi:predicted protein [Histoplasma capsulatum H143]|uniref:Uncharacterized protein n=1 Tax=Ajellomyces capsulatus (strain H143) TaxID=544712 RepID=C6HHZ7_AJECH|nr:predicted protein [Histoplasma capsulatum H143]
MSCGFGKPLMGGPLPHPRYPCQCEFCETPEKYWSWQKSVDVNAAGKNLPPQAIYRDSRLYQEYMLNTLLAGVPISGEEEVEPKDWLLLYSFALFVSIYYCTPVHPYTPAHPFTPVDHDARSRITPVHPFTPVHALRPSTITPVHLYA